MSRDARRRALRALGAAPLWAACPVPRAAAADAPAAPFSFALIGDLPYSDADEAVLAAMLAHVDEDELAFVLHVGDIKGSGEPCSDALLARRRAVLERSAHPLVLLPGDNEWTDCHRPRAGGHDPLERLDALRRAMWSRPGPLGRAPGSSRPPLALERQPGFPENVRWRVGPVHFVAAHVVGSDDGLGEYPGSRVEHARRTRANLDWLEGALEAAIEARADAFVVAAHANPFGRVTRPGHVPLIGALQEIAARFRNPIAFLHGDSHRFRVDRPLIDRHGRPAPHLLRVECFGHPMTAQWVRITWDPADPQRFHVAVREVPTRANGGG